MKHIRRYEQMKEWELANRNLKMAEMAALAELPDLQFEDELDRLAREYQEEKKHD